VETGGNNKFESIYSSKVRAGKRRTYFFDVRKTKGEDFYITITESTKKFNSDGYERHKIFLYKEDFNRFMNSLTEAVDHVKNDLMPDFDYELYERRQKEWEAQKELEERTGVTSTPETTSASEPTTTTEASEPAAEKPANDGVESEEDMSW
jgi:hypothetical protein